MQFKVASTKHGLGMLKSICQLLNGFNVGNVILYMYGLTSKNTLNFIALIQMDIIVSKTNSVHYF